VRTLWAIPSLLLLNAHYEAIPFTCGRRGERELWGTLLDTADPQACLWRERWTAVEASGPALAVLPIRAHKQKRRNPGNCHGRDQRNCMEAGQQ